MAAFLPSSCSRRGSSPPVGPSLLAPLALALPIRGRRCRAEQLATPIVGLWTPTRAVWIRSPCRLCLRGCRLPCPSTRPAETCPLPILHPFLPTHVRNMGDASAQIRRPTRDLRPCHPRLSPQAHPDSELLFPLLRGILCPRCSHRAAPKTTRLLRALLSSAPGRRRAKTKAPSLALLHGAGMAKRHATAATIASHH